MLMCGAEYMLMCVCVRVDVCGGGRGEEGCCGVRGEVCCVVTCVLRDASASKRPRVYVQNAPMCAFKRPHV